MNKINLAITFINVKNILIYFNNKNNYSLKRIFNLFLNS